MNHLAVDAATEVLSVALRRDRDTASDVLVASRDVGLRHTRRLMTLVHALMDEAELGPIDLDLVSCTRGPGSFTGLRIGMATAKGLAWAVAAARALDRPPLVSVSTLDAMAAAVASTAALVVPVIDGKKGRFYGAAYLAGRRSDRRPGPRRRAPSSRPRGKRREISSARRTDRRQGLRKR